MNNQMISNPKVEVSKGMMLNDKDYMNCLLSSLKALVKNYAVALTEVSNETLYQTYKQVFDGISSLQRETYELMFQRGWYPVECAPKEKIGMKYNQFNQEYTDLHTTNQSTAN